VGLVRPVQFVIDAGRFPIGGADGMFAVRDFIALAVPVGVIPSLPDIGEP